MVRKLALAVSLALGTLSVPAHALGLGELSSKSTLNQNFQGDITLLSVSPEELDSVRVRLADEEAFTRAGVDRPFYLSLLKFEPVLSGKGKPVIRVTSEFPIREPFMNFLVEVNWPKGRLLREFTVLLDPPTTTKRRPPKVAPAAKTSGAAPAAKASTGTAAPTAAGVPVTGLSDDGSQYGPVKSNDTAWSIAKKVRPSGVSLEQMMMALLNANPQAFLDNNINRLRRGQILRVPTTAEIQQLSRLEAREAYRQQQDEWLARREQRLQREAEGETAAQTAAEVPAAAVDDQLRIATARPEGSGEAGAGDDDALSPTARDLKSRLIVARENAETSRQEAETLRSRVDELQERLANMQKLLSLKDEQLAQLQDRVVGEGAVVGGEAAAPDLTLTGQLEAAAGAAETVTEGGQPEAEPQVSVEGAVAEGVGAVEAAVESAAQAIEAAPADYRIADIPPQIDADRIVMMATEAETVMQPEAPVSEVAVSEPAAVAIEPAAPPATAPQAPATTAPVGEPSEATAAQPADEGLIPASVVSMVEQNMVPIAAGGVALLGLIGFVATRGRRKTVAAESAVAATAAAAGAGTGVIGSVEPEAETEEPAVDQPVMDEEALSDLPDSAFLDEFSPSDINALQDETGEVDPVSEADVYIAYGRYQQAEELLRQAMNRDPGRLALKHKLLEVHYATRNEKAFVGLAQEMVNAGQDSVDEAAWARAQDMGRELAPDNALFVQREQNLSVDVAAAGAAVAGAGAVAGAVAAATSSAVLPASSTVDGDTLSLDDLELSELNAAYEEESTTGELERPSEVNITLDLEDESGSLADHIDQIDASMPESIPLEDFEGLDFELPAAEQGVAAAAEPDAADLITDSLDLDSMMAEAEAAVDQDDSLMNLDSDFSADELQAQLDELSDLSVLDSGFGDDEKAAQGASSTLGLVAEDTGIGEEGLDQPVDLSSELVEDDEGDDSVELAGLDEVGQAGEPAGEDEVATKLDLARAYVDMGDEDGARSILEEVVVEGNDMQRGDAEQLLARLG